MCKQFQRHKQPESTMSLGIGTSPSPSNIVSSVLDCCQRRYKHKYCLVPAEADPILLAQKKNGLKWILQR